jgi:hypothetical protein
MQELDLATVALVAGGYPTTGETMTIAGGIGGGVGASQVIAVNGGTLAGVQSALGGTTAIGVATAGAAGVAAAGIGGYAVGTAIYNNLPTNVQDTIGGTIHEMGNIVSDAYNQTVSGWSNSFSSFASMFN